MAHSSLRTSLWNGPPVTNYGEISEVQSKRLFVG
jgi:hypothetical protein